jgi:hypothetical protein
LDKTAHITARIEANRVPNTRTRKAIDELEAGGGEAFQGKTSKLFDKLSKPRKTQTA